MMRAVILFALWLLPAGLFAGPAEPAVVSGTIKHGGRTRRYFYHLPKRMPKGGKVPIVLILHSSRFKVEKIINITEGRFNTLGDEEGFIALYPEAVDSFWNDGRALKRISTHRGKVDDVGYLAALVELFIREHGADRDRVFAAGLAHGAMLLQRLACERPGVLAAMGLVSSALPEKVARSCPRRVPVPALIIHGTKDPFIRWKDTTVRVGRIRLGRILTVPDYVHHWIVRNGCSKTPVNKWLPDTDSKDGTRVKRYRYGECSGGGEVVFYEIRGGGHGWPGGRSNQPEWLTGRLSRDLDATRVIWEFFREQGTR